MNCGILWRAKTIVKRGEIRIEKNGCSPPNFLHFKVKCRSGDWTDVYYRKDRHGIEGWSCNALGTKKNGEKFGCVFFTGDKSKPFCSHTLAAKMLMDRLMEEI